MATQPNNPQNKSLIDQEDFHTLKDVPPESDWIEEHRSRSEKTAHGYEVDVNDFKRFLGIKKPEDYRRVSRRHVSEWINHLKSQKLTNETIARKVSALSSLFKFYCEQSALKDNPCRNITRPKVQSNIGKSDIISDSETKKFLNAPPSSDLRGLRDRAILAVFCFMTLRRSEVSNLKVKNIHNKEGVPHLLVRGKGEKTRDLPLNPEAMQKIYAYLEADNRLNDLDEPIFCSLKKYKDADGLLKHMSTTAIYDIVQFYANMVGLKLENFHPHCLRSTGATNAIDNGVDLVALQHFLGHANIQTTRMYVRDKSAISDSPAFKIKY